MACTTTLCGDNCPCPVDCKNHGHCCACITLHRKENIGSLVECMKIKATTLS